MPQHAQKQPLSTPPRQPGTHTKVIKPVSARGFPPGSDLDCNLVTFKWTNEASSCL